MGEMDRRLPFPKKRITMEAVAEQPESWCSSLSGPYCVGLDEVDVDELYEYDSNDVMTKINLLSEERQRAQTTKERDAFVAIRRKKERKTAAVYVEKERLNRVRRARAHGDEKEDEPRYEEAKDQQPKPVSVSQGEYLASVHRAAKRAASEVQCSLCRSISVEALAFAATTTQSGRAMPEANILHFLQEMCLGDVPRLLHFYTILPLPPPDGEDADGKERRRSFAWCERDGKSSLTTFEQGAFHKTCAKVIDEIDIELSERAFAAVKATTDASPFGDRFLTRARVEAETCASFCGDRDAVEVGSSSLNRREAPETALRRSRGCVYSAKGYWAMEVCFEKTVRQFHVEWPRIDQVVSLGTFEAQGVGGSALPLSALPPEYENQNSVRFRFVEHFFAGGDLCAGVRDESAKNRPTGPGKARRSVVRWVCAPDGKERIWSTEPKTCEYAITVFHPALCSIPQFRVETTGIAPSSRVRV